MSTLPVTQAGQGYITEPFVQGGVEGFYQLTPLDGQWVSSFTPSWDGGISSDSSPTEGVSPVNPSSGIVGGGDTVYNWGTPSTSSDGDAENVVSYPTYNAGSSGGEIRMIDYSSALSVIGSTLQSHALANNDALSTINENLQKQLEIDDGGALQVAPEDMTEYDVDTSPATALLDEVSGWDYSFGLEQNVIGETFPLFLAIRLLRLAVKTWCGMLTSPCLVTFMSIPLLTSRNTSRRLFVRWC